MSRGLMISIHGFGATTIQVVSLLSCGCASVALIYGSNLKRDQTIPGTSKYHGYQPNTNFFNLPNKLKRWMGYSTTIFPFICFRLSNLTALRTLHVAENGLFADLPDIFARLTLITELDVHKCHLRALPERSGAVYGGLLRCWIVCTQVEPCC